MKKTAQTTIVLNALALAGMLVFASQSADAASTSVDPAKTPATVNAQNGPTVVDESSPDVADTHEAEDSTPDVADTHEVEDAGNIADIGNQDFETPDIGDFETPDSN